MAKKSVPWSGSIRISDNQIMNNLNLGQYKSGSIRITINRDHGQYLDQNHNLSWSAKRMFWATETDHQRKKNVFDGKFSFLVMWPWKRDDSAFLVQNGLILETVAARKHVERNGQNFWITKGKKKCICRKFSFLVMWPWKKSDDSAFLVQNGIILETVAARAKRTKFWDHQRKKMNLM